MEENSSVVFSKSQMNEGNLKFRELSISETEFENLFEKIKSLKLSINTAAQSAAEYRASSENRSSSVVSFTLPVERIGDAQSSGLGALFQLFSRSDNS
jgi:hypothetical protein